MNSASPTATPGSARSSRRWLALAVLFSLVATFVPAAAQNTPVTFETESLAVETAAGERHAFTVEIAETPAQMAQGLMFRRKLARDAGMLFFYRPPRRAGMWMKNTLIPLDMLFIEADGRIVKLVERTVPLSLKTIASDGPVSAVLELNGGTAARLGIAPGDRVVHPAFAGP